MVWVSEGFVPVVTDIQATALANDPASLFRGALGTVVTPLVAAAIAADGTVAAAAAAGVNTAITAQDIIRGSDQRAPKAGVGDSFRVRDNASKVAFEVDSNGDTNAYGNLKAGSATQKPYDGFRITDQAGRIAFDVNAVTGDTTIGRLVGGGSVSRGIAVIGHLQSNTEGRGRPFSAELDPQDPRILMWNGNTNSLSTATVPLWSQQQMVGLSPLTTYAREIVKEAPPTTVVMIIDAAVGDTGVIKDTGNGAWDPTYAGANAKLYNNSLAIIDAALSAFVTAYGFAPDLHFVGIGTEADMGTGSTQSAVAAGLDRIISGYTTKYAAYKCTFVYGGVLPEFIASQVSGAAIRAAYVDTPNRNYRTAYIDGVANGGQAPVGIGTGTTAGLGSVHGGRAAVVELGRRIRLAQTVALANVDTTPATPPLTVTATKWFVSGVASLAISWSWPLTHVTGYSVQYRVNGGSWVTATTTSIDTSATVTGLTLAATDLVEVQVATVNALNTSAYSTPIKALGA